MRRMRLNASTPRARRFAPYMKTVREGVKAGVAWANGEVDPKAFVPPSDAVYFG